MATKQGLTAQLSQASEDAKRAVLQRSTAVIKSSSQWFSNLNTTCTIKSAPPRTPDVLQLLSVKSGFLYKRNEQHVWQARWCCVVPHMFLYYFDAVPLPQPRGSHPSVSSIQQPQQQQPQMVTLPPPPPTTSQQEAWNTAVRYGYDGGRGKQGPRSSLYHVFPTNAGGGSSSGNTTAPEGSHSMILPSADGSGGTHTTMMLDMSENNNNSNSNTTNSMTATSSNLPPAGIIDLECYTSVHRSHQNPLVLELAGDDTVNPDLRGFYFVAKDEDEAEDWTQALLSQRHSQLLDERDAYQQVCDGFALQLQELHSQLDACQLDLEQVREEVYSVRCQMEDQRRSCWKLVEEALEHRGDNNNNTTTNMHKSNNLEEIRAQDGSAVASVQLLLDYTKSLEETCAQLQQSNIQLQQEKEAAQHAHLQKEDHSQEVIDLQDQVKDWQNQYQRLQDAYHAERLVWQQDTSAHKATLQQYKTKHKEMQAHKKILKREVIELRKKCEEMESEVNLLQHRHGKELQHEQSKLELLERYLAKMESQVKVQQNMMEMMSSSMSYYGGSHYGGEGGGGGASAHQSLRGGGPMELPRSIVAPRVYPPPPPVQLVPPVDNHDHHHDADHAAALAAAMNGDDSLNTTLLSDAIVHGDPQPTDVAAAIKTTNVTATMLLPPTTPRRNPTQLSGVSTHQQQEEQQQQQQQDGLEESYQQDEDDFRRSNYTNSNNMAVSALADDMDNKSHLSELTEDRTQRQFDFVFHHRQQKEQQRQQQQQEQNSTNPKETSNSSARNGINSNMTSPSNNNASPSTRNTSGTLEGPPSYIMGGMDKSAALSSSQLPPPPHHSHLDTITSRAAATTQNVAASTSPPSPTGQSQNVAHRARMDADNKAAVTMKLRTPFVPTNSSSKKVRARTSGAASVASNASGRGDRSINTAGSFLSNLGKRLEQALDNSILGVPDISTESSLQSKDFYEDNNEDDEDEDDDDPFHQYRRNRVPFEEKKDPEQGSNVNSKSKRPQPPPPQPSNLSNINGSSASYTPPVTVDAAAAAAASVGASPKSISPSAVSHHSGLSLHERQKLQRAKQLAFLKQQGIIQKDDEVRGGAGGGSGNSVSSSPSTWIDSTVSLTTTTTNPSLSTQSVQQQQQRPHKTTGSRRAVAR